MSSDRTIEFLTFLKVNEPISITRMHALGLHEDREQIVRNFSYYYRKGYALKNNGVFTLSALGYKRIQRRNKKINDRNVRLLCQFHHLFNLSFIKNQRTGHTPGDWFHVKRIRNTMRHGI